MAYKIQPAQLKEKWEQYKKQCDEHTVEQRYRNEVVIIKKPKIYLLEVVCCLVGLDGDDLENLRKNRNYKKLIKQIEFAVLARKLDALVNGEGSASGLIFDLKANHGLHIKKANKALEDQHWDITMNLGNESVGKSVGHEVNRSMGEEEDAFGHGLEASGSGSAGEDGESSGQEVNRSVREEGEGRNPEVVAETKHVDPSVLGEPILLTKQYPTVNPEDERMVEIKQVVHGLITRIKKPASSLTPEERAKFDYPKGWIPPGKYVIY